MISRVTVEPGNGPVSPVSVVAHRGVGRIAPARRCPTEQQILNDYLELEPDGFRAVYEFAAKMGRRVAL
ncbi:MAG TPA: hypothetical protein VME43_25645 [Bryobacteraceae bacterium]|nr:hypothetical protein [Bryobacteraceae bacterium]